MRIQNYLSHRFIIALLTGIVFVLFSAISVGAQDQLQTQNADQFRDRLCQLLQDSGWSTDQIDTLREQPVDWAKARSTEAKTVAYALMYDKSHGTALHAEAQANLAIQLAITAREMKQFGQTDQEIAGAAVQATISVKTMLAERQGANSGDRETTITGDQLRTMIQDRIRSSFKDHTQAQLRTQSRMNANPNAYMGNQQGGPTDSGKGSPANAPAGSPGSQTGHNGASISDTGATGAGGR